MTTEILVVDTGDEAYSTAMSRLIDMGAVGIPSSLIHAQQATLSELSQPDPIPFIAPHQIIDFDNSTFYELKKKSKPNKGFRIGSYNSKSKRK